MRAAAAIIDGRRIATIVLDDFRALCWLLSLSSRSVSSPLSDDVDFCFLIDVDAVFEAVDAVNLMNVISHSYSSVFTSLSGVFCGIVTFLFTTLLTFPPTLFAFTEYIYIKSSLFGEGFVWKFSFSSLTFLTNPASYSCHIARRVNAIEKANVKESDFNEKCR